MQIQLTEELSEFINEEFGEAGMGYHIVDVYLKNQKLVEDVIIFNSEIMDWPDTEDMIDLDDITMIGMKDKTTVH